MAPHRPLEEEATATTPPREQPAQITAQDSTTHGQPPQELATFYPRHNQSAQATAQDLLSLGQPSQELATSYHGQGFGEEIGSAFAAPVPAFGLPSFISTQHQQQPAQTPRPYLPATLPRGFSAFNLPGAPHNTAHYGTQAARSDEVPEARTLPTGENGGSGKDKALTRRKQEKKHLLPVPRPTAAYAAKAGETPTALEDRRRLLVILDLNGTLGYRKGSKKGSFVPRPGCEDFLEYLFEKHCVLVWSSAVLHNVKSMCWKVFSQEQLSSPSFLGIWGREQLHLTPAQSKQKIYVYKQLSWVWGNPAFQAKQDVPGVRWDQTNTVLIDDTVEKAAAEPHNLVLIPEFRAGKPEDRVLGRVKGYLGDLEDAANVSAAMRVKPFDFTGAGETAGHPLDHRSRHGVVE